jgi:hypothetical protein
MKTNVTSIYEAMKAAGVQIESHATDLYVPVNDVTRAIIAEYESKENVRTFISNIEPRVPWFDIPFAYDPAWKAKFKGGKA